LTEEKLELFKQERTKESKDAAVVQSLNTNRSRIHRNFNSIRGNVKEVLQQKKQSYPMGKSGTERLDEEVLTTGR